MHNSARDIHERAHSGGSRRANDETFQLFANTAPVMIWISGVDKLCTYVNQRWLDFTGRPLDAELGNGWSEGVHPDDLGPCLDQYTTAVDRRESFQFEYRLRRSDAQYRWIFDSGVPRFEADGSFAGYIGSVIDVTQHKLAEEALSTMSQRLIEELHMLHGELMIDEKKLYAGEFIRAQAGTADHRVWSETGCTCVLVTSTEDSIL